MAQATTIPNTDESDHGLLRLLAEARSQLKRSARGGAEELKYHLVETLYEVLGVLATQVAENDDRIAELEAAGDEEGLTQDTAEVIHTFVGAALEVLMELTDLAETHRPDLIPQIVEVTEMAAPLTEMIESLIMEEGDEYDDEDDEAEAEQAPAVLDDLPPNELPAEEPVAVRVTPGFGKAMSQGDSESQGDPSVAGHPEGGRRPEEPDGNLEAATGGRRAEEPDGNPEAAPGGSQSDSIDEAVQVTDPPEASEPRATLEPETPAEEQVDG